jgi:hypothetical protein
MRSKRRNKMSPSEKNWNVWRTLEIGSYHSAESIRMFVEQNGFYITPMAMDILTKIPVAGTRRLINLAVVKVEQLGLADWVSIDAIFESAKTQGLSICPAEVGPMLRLDYPNQRPGEILYIAMDPISSSRYGNLLFLVSPLLGRLTLTADSAEQNWKGSDQFVFVLRN